MRQLRHSAAIAMLLASMGASMGQAPHDLLVRNFERTIIHRDRAFQVGEPLLVAGPEVVSARWSWDGAYLLIEQVVGATTVAAARAAISDPEARSQRILTLYDVASGTSREIFRRDTRSFVIEDFEWMQGGEAVMLASSYEVDAEGRMSDEPKMSLLRIDPRSGRAREFVVDAVDGKPHYRLAFSPDGKFGLIQAIYDGAVISTGGLEETVTTRSYYVVGSDLKLVPVQLPEDSRSLVFYFADGEPYAMVISGGASGMQRSWFRVDPATGALSSATRPEGITTDRRRPSDVLQTRTTTASATNSSKSTTVHAMWLETREPSAPNRLLLAGDATDGSVAPNLRAVSYVAHGSLYVRPIEEISLSVYLAQKEEYERMMAMRRAREVAMSFLMYGADHEDMFPSIRSDYIMLVSPYLKDTDSLNGFLYTFQGGLITDVKDPSRTQLGYIELPNGRAVAFIDGHVEWVPNRSG